MPRSVTKIIIVLPGGFVKRFPGIFYPEAAKGVFVKGRRPFLRSSHADCKANINFFEKRKKFSE